MSRNPVARNAWKVNRASAIPDRRDVLIERAVAHETDRERAARLDGGPVVSRALEDEVDWPCRCCGLVLVSYRGAICGECLDAQDE